MWELLGALGDLLWDLGRWLELEKNPKQCLRSILVAIVLIVVITACLVLLWPKAQAFIH